MKKIFLAFTILFAVAVTAQSCGSTKGKGGTGCPSGNPNKPFRA